MDDSILFWKQSLSTGSKGRGKWLVSFGAIQGNCISKSPSLEQGVGNGHAALSLDSFFLPGTCYRKETVHRSSEHECTRVCVLRAVPTSETSHSLNSVPQVCACEGGIYQQMNRRQQSSPPRNNSSHPFPGRLVARKPLRG